ERVVQSMWSVVEEQQVPVGEKVRRMLAGQRRRPELPVDGTAAAVDHHDGRDVAKADQDVSIRHLEDAVSDGPHIAVVLEGRDHVVHWIQMLPASPLPNDLAISRHLDKIRAIHLAIVVLRTEPAASDPGNDVIRKRLLTDEQDVSVPKPNAVVVMVGMVHLPQNPPVPIHFQRGATLIRRLADVARVWNLTIVEERPALGEISGLTGRVRHSPGVNDVALHIDEVNGPVGRRQRGKQREPRESAIRIAALYRDAAALYRD